MTNSSQDVGRRAGPRARSKFFAYAASAILVVVFIGFSRTFYLRPLTAVRDMLGRFPPLAVMLHGALLSIWFLLFSLQAWLVALRRIDIHRRLGVWGIMTAALVAISSAIVTYQFVPRALEAGRPRQVIAAILVSNALSLAMFAALVAAAVHLRRNPEAHKRLMLCASLAILAPAFAAGNISGDRPLGPFLKALLPAGPLTQPFMVTTVVAVVALAIHDYVNDRRISVATALGGTALIAKQAIVQAVGQSVYAQELVRWFE